MAALVVGLARLARLARLLRLAVRIVMPKLVVLAMVATALPLALAQVAFTVAAMVAGTLRLGVVVLRVARFLRAMIRLVDRQVLDLLRAVVAVIGILVIAVVTMLRARLVHGRVVVPIAMVRVLRFVTVAATIIATRLRWLVAGLLRAVTLAVTGLRRLVVVVITVIGIFDIATVTVTVTRLRWLTVTAVVVIVTVTTVMVIVGLVDTVTAAALRVLAVIFKVAAVCADGRGQHHSR